MKVTFIAVKVIISIIGGLIFLCGVVLTCLGGYDFISVFSKFAADGKNTTGLMAIGLLHAVDAFLVATVFFVLSLGIVILFNNPEKEFPVKLPGWLRVKNFMELKAILWEAILTTLVVAYLARFVEQGIEGKELTLQHLIIPGGIFLISVSLYLLKRSEK